MTAFFCQTPMHIFRAIHMQLSLLQNKSADIYVFDTFNSSFQQAESLKKVSLFANVYWIKKKDFITKSKKQCFQLFTRTSHFMRILKPKKYDKLFFFNLSFTINTIAYTFAYRTNPHVEVNYVEDAPLLYPIEDGSVSVSLRLFWMLIRFRDPGRYISNWWLSSPEMTDYSGKASKRKLPTVDKNDDKFRKIVNEVFHYVYSPELEKADILIMEECYHTDGLMQNQDIALFRYIRDKLPHKNFLVKMHPRSIDMRFNKDFTVMKNTGIPWEVYCLNNNLESKIMVALSCSTLISSKFLYDEEPRVVMLYKLLKNDIKRLDGELYFTKEWESSMGNLKKCYQNQERFQIVESMPELDKLLEQMNHEK